MGMPPFYRKSEKEYSGSILGRHSSNTEYVTVYKNLPNPDPSNYKIINIDYIYPHVIMKIKYLDCTNYEGIKILVFRCTKEEILNQKLIDPHFSENKNFISPIARFEPTEIGWHNAIKFAQLLQP